MEEQSLNEREPEPSSGKASFLDKLVSTGLGSGYSPVAPGTAGSIVALLFYSIDGFERLYVILPAILIFLAWGSYSAGKMESVYGHDPSRVVIDEIVGMWITLLFIPKRFFLVVIGFLVFRFLDIFKPFPASYFDRKTGGISIMMDDVVSGIYANIALQLYLYLMR